VDASSRRVEDARGAAEQLVAVGSRLVDDATTHVVGGVRMRPASGRTLVDVDLDAGAVGRLKAIVEALLLTGDQERSCSANDCMVYASNPACVVARLNYNVRSTTIAPLQGRPYSESTNRQNKLHVDNSVLNMTDVRLLENSVCCSVDCEDGEDVPSRIPIRLFLFIINVSVQVL